MNTHQTALVGGWRSKVLGVNRPTITRRIPLTGAPRRGGAGASNAVATPNARTADAAEAIRRSPLGLDLPSNHPGLALVASSLEEDEISEAAVRLVREHGLMTAKAMIANDPTVLTKPSAEDVAIFKALQSDGGSRRVRPSSATAGVVDAIKRSPLMLDVSPDAPGLPKLAGLSDDLIIGAAVVLMREHGLFDAKAMVAADASVLVPAADKAARIAAEEEAERLAAIAEAEAMAAAEAAGEEYVPAAAGAPVASAFAHVADALKRSPLMLDVTDATRGLSAAAALSDDEIVGAAVVLLREHGLMDAKAMVAADLSALVPAAQTAKANWAAEAAERAAELAELAPVPAEFADAVDAIKRSPLMLDVSGDAPGLSAVAALSDLEIIGAAVVLLREHGLMDAKALVASDVTVLIPAAQIAKANWAKEEAERLAEQAELAPVPAEFADAVDAIKRSPLMLDVSGDAPGLAQVAALSDAEIIGAAVVLLREHGLMDAKAMVTADVTVLVPAAKVAQAKWAQEEAERAAENKGEFADALDAIKRSPLMLDLPADAAGLAAVAELSDAEIIGAAVVLLREHGLMDAKVMVAADASVLVPAADKARAIWAEEELERARAEFPEGWGPRDLAEGFSPAAYYTSSAPVPAAYADAVDAIKRSPLMLEVGGDARGLAQVAALSDAEIIGAAVVLLREHGLMDAKALVASDLTVLIVAAETAKANWALEEAERLAEQAELAPVPAEFADAVDAIKRSPLMLDVSGDAPGLAQVAALSDAEIIGAAVVLLREHGLMDAKALVASDLTVLIPAAQTAKANWAKEEAERLAELAAAEAGPCAAALDAIKRSPLMLDVSPDAPGLDAVAELSDDLIIGAACVLLREHGLMDAKAMVAADVSVLVPAAQVAARIAAEAEAERLAAIAEAEAMAAAEAAGEEYVPAAAPVAAAPAAAAKPAVGEEARVIEAIADSPLMLTLPAGSKGLKAVAALSSPMIVASCVQLMRVEGMFDAKEILRQDASILLDVAKEVERIEAEEAAIRAAELAEAEAMAAAEAAGEEYVPAAAAPAPVAAAPAAATKPAVGEEARVIEAIADSPLMLTLPAGSKGLKAVAALSSPMIVASCVLLMRVEGMFDAKEILRQDASILLDVAKEVERIEAEEAAIRAAELAEAEAMAAAEAAGEEYVPAAAAPAPVAAAPAAKPAVGEEARVIEAIADSPLMLTLPAGSKGLKAVAALSSPMIVASCVLLMRVEGMFDAKEMLREDASILLDVSKEVERIEAEEAAIRAAELAEAEAMAAAEAAGEEYVPAAAAPAPVAAAAVAAAPAPKAAVGEEARVIAAIERSPLMLTLPAGANGLKAVAALDDAMIVASCVLLMRVEGMFDAKELLREDASILIDVSKEVERIEAEEAAIRAAELAEAEAMAAAEAAGEEYVPAAAAPAAAPAAAGKPAVGEEARVIAAIERSPLMLTLPAGTQGLGEVAALDDAMIVASCVLLMRVEGFMDAKFMLQKDVTILLDVAKEVERIEAEEAAIRAAELAEAEAMAAAEAAGEEYMPAAAAPAASGEVADVLDAIKRSPLMLDLPATTAGLAALIGLSDDDLVDCVLVVVREHGLLDAKDLIRADASILRDAYPVVLRQREVEAAEKAAAEAEAAALAAAEEEELMAVSMSNGRHY